MLAVLQYANGSFTVAREGLSEGKQAMVNFHQVCTDLWNDANTNYAEVRLVDEAFNEVDRETIAKPQPAPEEQGE